MKIAFVILAYFAFLYILKKLFKMKKTILYYFVVTMLVFVTNTAKSQFILTNFTTENTELDTLITIDSYGTIENLSPDTMYIGLIRTIQYLVPGHEENFCHGPSCYPPGTDSSLLADPAIIPPGGSDGDFHVTVLAHGACGTSSIRYNFYDQNNVSNSIPIDLTFGFCTATSVNELTSSNGVSRPKGNPANAYTSFSFNLENNKGNTQLRIYNMLGSLVQSFALPQKNGELVVNTSEYKQGVYLCSVMNNNRVVSTYKLIVQH